MIDEKWQRRFVELARYTASWSKDPSTKVGAVIFDEDKRIISVGYNGLPKGVCDLPETLNDRDLKYKMIVHAEINAILFGKRNLAGLYLSTWPFMPCIRCATAVVQAGIRCCIAPKNDNPRWKDDFVLTELMFAEAGIELVLLDDFLFE